MSDDWLARIALPTLVLVALLLVLWPTRGSGRRLLRTWGIAEPTGSQTVEAVRYLGQRRALYVVLFLALPPLVNLVLPAGGLFVPLLAGLLVAELVATLRPVSGVRVASLDPRTWSDLLPHWATGLGCGLVALAAGLAGFAIAFGPRPGEAWVVLGAVGLCVAAVVGLVHLAVRRPSSADQEVDAALRTRTARVAVAVGFGWLGVLAGRAQATLVGQHSPLGQDWLDVLETAMTVVLFGSVVAWFWLAVPTRRSLARNG